ncbi:hypothetical protein SESBI_40105 [Sesbania bispinosa]|nr:hypothetical protein SESBI_40105 [Sesbania bispinosa]
MNREGNPNPRSRETVSRNLRCVVSNGGATPAHCEQGVAMALSVTTARRNRQRHDKSEAYKTKRKINREGNPNPRSRETMSRNPRWCCGQRRGCAGAL